jgi:hypothetical protein
LSSPFNLRRESRNYSIPRDRSSHGSINADDGLDFAALGKFR